MNKKQKKTLERILIAVALVIVLKLLPALPMPVELALYCIPYLVVGWDVLRKALKGIKNRQPFDECFLMAVATVGAFALGDYVEGCAVIIFYQIGELFQGVAVGKSRRSISALMDIRPDSANLEAADGGAAYGRRVYTVTAEAGAELTVFEVCTAAQPLAAELRLTAAEGAHLRVVQLLNPAQGAVLRHELSAQLAEHAKLDLISLQLGDGAVYADHQIALAGDGAALRADLGYLARRSDTADIDLTVEQLGKSTVSEIHASGALMERAKKVFRGTIDFKRGSAGSVGSENETVLLLGEDAENKTVPVILCAEENVEGSHGATIGELDTDTLFYFASRGIDRTAAEAILARAAVERLARMAEDEAFSARALGALAQVLCTKEERE